MTGRMRRQMRRGLRHGIVFRTEDPPTNGGGGGGGGTNTKPEKSVSQVVASLVARHGSAETALGVLAGENRDYRNRHRRDEETINDLRSKFPKEGSVVLTPEQAKEWEKYTALGNVKEVKEKVEKATELENEVAGFRSKELMREVGEAVRYNSTVLHDRVTADALHVELKDEQVDDGKGGKVHAKVPYVRKAADENAALEPLTAYAEKNWEAYLPSLKVEATAGNRGGTAGGGVRLPATTAASKDGAGGGSLLELQMEKRKAVSERTNPLTSSAKAS